MGSWCSKARTRQLWTAESRRTHLSSYPLLIDRHRELSDKADIIREYVDTGKGHLISTTCFRPKSSSDIKVKGMICYSPGYSSFSDWSDSDIAISFLERGYIFVCFDHYGHGRSDGGWLTIKAKNDYNLYIEDAFYIFERAKQKYSPTDNENFCYFLFGHSMGGAVSIQLSKMCKNSLHPWDGLILSAPMVKISEEMQPHPLLIKMASFIVSFCPNARLVPTSSMSDKLTRNEKYFEFVLKSPLLYEDRPALNTAFNLLAFANKVESELDKVNIPLLVMHGEMDKITDPKMSQLLYDKCSSKLKKIKIFKGAFHALCIDECSNDVYKEIDEWVQDVMKKT